MWGEQWLKFWLQLRRPNLVAHFTMELIDFESIFIFQHNLLHKTVIVKKKSREDFYVSHLKLPKE